VDVVVVGELCQREECVPIVLSFSDEDSQVLFQFLIDPFHLFVGLWVVGVDSSLPCPHIPGGFQVEWFRSTNHPMDSTHYPMDFTHYTMDSTHTYHGFHDILHGIHNFPHGFHIIPNGFHIIPLWNP